jgi:hypothetical protein
MILTVIFIAGVLAIVSVAFLLLHKTDCRRLSLRTWLVELEIERGPKPRRQALPPSKERSP